MASRRAGSEVFKSAGETFRSLYGGLKSTSNKSFGEGIALDSSRRTIDSAEQLGHPSFSNLRLGDSHRAHAVVLFVDIGGFTKLSLALDQQQLHELVQALTVTAINVIRQNGGHIGEFTGDGVMAYFGDDDLQEHENAAAAFAAVGLLFKTIKEIVNPELENRGQPTITISAGMECGQVLWTRVGTEEVSQVKPIGEATFLAGKLSTRKFTHAWECKIGPSISDWLPDDYKEMAQQYAVSVSGKAYTRALNLFIWPSYIKDYLFEQASTEARVRKSSGLGAALAATSLGGSPVPSRDVPRKIKDQPFF